MSMNRSDIAGIVEKAGCRFLGIVELGPEPRYDAFSKWLDLGLPEYLAYLERYQDVRRDSRKLLARGAKSAIIIGLFYGSDRDSEGSKETRIAKYARYPDYHGILRKRGQAIAEEIIQSGEYSVAYDREDFRICVDTAPVLERALAERSAEGFIGKNTCFIHPRYGSFFCLAEIIFSFDVSEPDKSAAVDPHKRIPESGGCGTCRRCEVHCPTGALSGHSLDVKKCLSYWTIENRGVIPEEFWPFLGRYWYGCDICQDVCPYNREAVNQSLQMMPKQSLMNLDLFIVACMDQEYYERVFGGSPLVRAKIHGLKRNALIALYIEADPRLEEAMSCIAKQEWLPHWDVLLETIAVINSNRKG